MKIIRMSCALTILMGLTACNLSSSGQITSDDIQNNLGTRVFPQGSEIVYDGELSQEANDIVKNLLSKAGNNYKTLNIKSNGGEVNLGMDLGEMVFDNQLDVKVNTFCFSSCANFVFPSGTNKLLAKNAVVAYHGGANSDNFDESIFDGLTPAEKEQALAQYKEYLAAAKEREKVFFAKIGVDPRLVTEGQQPEYAHFESEGYAGWYYELSSFPVLGITNIKLIDGSWSYKQPNPDLKLFPIKLSS